MADVTNTNDEIYETNETKILSGEFLNFYTPRRQRIRSCKVYFSPKQAGTGTPSPTNVRPISDWTGVEINHCGKNLFGGDVLIDAIANTNSTAVISGDEITFKAVTDNYEPIFERFKENTQYTFIITGYKQMANRYINLAIEYTDGTSNLLSLPTNHIADQQYTIVKVSDENKTIKCLRNHPANYQNFTLIGSESGVFEGVITKENFVPYKTNISIPKEYQEVEYIESTGTQHINTNYYIQTEKIKILANFNTGITGSEKDLVGNQDTSTGRFVVGCYNYRWFAHAKEKQGSEDNAYSDSFDTSKRMYNIEIDYNLDINEKSIVVNGSKYTAAHTRSIISTNPLQIFADGNNKFKFGCKCYLLKIFDNDNLVLDLIPCYRKSDHEPGMYDTISGQFYTNSGTGEFILGPAVNPSAIDWSEEVGTVYGGYVDLVSGELVETYQTITLDGQTRAPQGSYNLSNTTPRYFLIPSTGCANYLPKDLGVCNKANVAHTSLWLYGDSHVWEFTLNAYNQLHVVFDNETLGIDPSETTAQKNAKINSWLAENPMTFSVPLSSTAYITHTLSPATLSTLARDNNFWSNADRIEIEYDYIGVFDAMESRKNITKGTPHLESASGNIVSFSTDMAANLKECKVYFKPKQEGEGDPSPENVRPIHGWDGITINSGNEVLTIPEWEVGAIDADTHNVKHYYNWYKTNNSTRVRCKNLCNLDINKTYRVIWNTNDYELVTQPYDSDGYAYKPSSPHNIWSTSSYEFSGVANVAVTIRKKDVSNITVNDAELADVKIISYSSINIAFPKTIYGGYVDLVKGEVVETHGIAKDFSVSRQNNGFIAYYTQIDSNKSGDFYCNIIGEYGSFSTSNMNKNIIQKDKVGLYLYLALDETIDINDLQLIYEHISIIHHQLTPQTLTTLRDSNTIWSNSNDQIQIKYYKHEDLTFQHIPTSDVIGSNDNFLIVTDDGFVIGTEDDFIVY